MGGPRHKGSCAVGRGGGGWNSYAWVCLLQGLAACGIHVFVAVSVGVLCDMWHVSAGGAGHPLGDAQPGTGRRKWVVGGLAFDASSLAFKAWGHVSAFAGSRAHLGVTMMFYSGPWVLGTPERVHSLPQGGILLGRDLGGHQFLCSGLTSVPKPFDV